MSPAGDITCKAAVCWGAGEGLVIEDVVVGAPKKGEVLHFYPSFSYVHGVGYRISLLLWHGT